MLYHLFRSMCSIMYKTFFPRNVSLPFIKFAISFSLISANRFSLGCNRICFLIIRNNVLRHSTTLHRPLLLVTLLVLKNPLSFNFCLFFSGLNLTQSSTHPRGCNECESFITRSSSKETRGKSQTIKVASEAERDYFGVP